MASSSRCGQPMRRYEIPGHPALPGHDPVCGRRAGHPGWHVSEDALRRQPPQAPSGSPAAAAAIRSARVRAGLSQYRLAAAVGVSRSCVQMYEDARRTPSAGAWVQLELALGPLGIVRETAPEAPQEVSRVA
jgi:DNA-binding XRE family transcriptional regulator